MEVGAPVVELAMEQVGELVVRSEEPVAEQVEAVKSQSELK